MKILIIQTNDSQVRHLLGKDNPTYKFEIMVPNLTYPNLIQPWVIYLII